MFEKQSCLRDLRVLVVDDHELTRISLKLALSTQNNIKLVGLASNGKEAVQMTKHHHPDVIVLDLQMPVMDGLSASNQIKSIEPHAQIIAYSSIEDSQTEIMSRKCKIDAFCQKDTSTEALIQLVNQLGQRALRSKSST